MLVTKQSLGAIDNQSMVKKSMAIVNWLLIYFQRNSYRFGTTWEWLNDDIIYVSFSCTAQKWKFVIIDSLQKHLHTPNVPIYILKRFYRRV